MNTFLNKAFNVEYVFLILTGIIKIMQAQENKFQKFKQDMQKMHQLLEVASQSQGMYSNRKSGMMGGPNEMGNMPS